MNALNELISRKREKLLSLFFTAGYPELDSTIEIIKASENFGVDFLEVGMPYSDPLADGPVIQDSSTRAIAKGMTMEILFQQLEPESKNIKIPLLLMGYLNPVLQFGMERFLIKANACGISGVILPDLPIKEYLEQYKPLFLKYNLSFVSLITPHTSEARIRMIDENSDSFIYAVSSASTTGKQQNFGQAQREYFAKIKKMNLKNPVVAGFGIHNEQTLQQAWQNANGAICGSAFLKKLAVNKNAVKAICTLFIDLGLQTSNIGPFSAIPHPE